MTCLSVIFMYEMQESRSLNSVCYDALLINHRSTRSEIGKRALWQPLQFLNSRLLARRLSRNKISPSKSRDQLFYLAGFTRRAASPDSHGKTPSSYSRINSSFTNLFFKNLYSSNTIFNIDETDFFLSTILLSKVLIRRGYTIVFRKISIR